MTLLQGPLDWFSEMQVLTPTGVEKCEMVSYDHFDHQVIGAFLLDVDGDSQDGDDCDDCDHFKDLVH